MPEYIINEFSDDDIKKIIKNNANIIKFLIDSPSKLTTF